MSGRGSGAARDWLKCQEALVMSNSRLCAQVVACDARAFVEFERARVAEAEVQQVRSRLIALETGSKTRISALEAQSKAEISAKDAIIQAKDAEVSRLQAEITRLQTKLARREAQPAAVTLPQLQQHLDRLQQQLWGQVLGGYVTRHTSHVTRHTSHVTRHTSRVTRHASHVTRHTSLPNAGGAYASKLEEFFFRKFA